MTGIMEQTPVIKLLMRKGEILEHIWKLTPSQAVPDLVLEMTKALYVVPRDVSKADVFWYANHSGRFWMDAQGMTLRSKIITLRDAHGIPHDTFEGIRIIVQDDLT